MDMVLRFYFNKISHLTKCTNTQPKKIAKMRKTLMAKRVFLRRN